MQENDAKGQTTSWSAVVGQPDQLGESPFWHPRGAQALLGGHPGAADPAVELLIPARVESWAMPMEPGCIAPMRGGGLVIALRDGIYRRASWRVACSARWPISATTSRRRASTTARPIRWGASGPAPCTSRGRAQGRAVLHRPARPNAGGKPLVELKAHNAIIANGLAWSPDAHTRVLGRHDQPCHPCLGLGCAEQPDEPSSRIPAVSRPSPQAGSRASPAMAAVPTAPRWTSRATTGAAMFEGRRLAASSRRPASLLAGVCAAGALPDHALLRRRRPQDTVRDQRQLQPSDRGAAGTAAVRLRDRDAGRVPGLPVNFVSD